MNFLAHGHRWLDRPNRLAGTALPDWLAMLAPASRLRGQRLQLPDAADRSARAEIVRGVRIHHAEDTWFHQQPAFDALVREGIAVFRRVADGVAEDRRFKPLFLAHITVEMLLDGWLLRRHPGLGAAWTDAVQLADLDAVEAFVASEAPVPAPGLATRIRTFRGRAYADGWDERPELARRLIAVAGRVGVRAPDEAAVATAFGSLEPSVHRAAPSLLPPPWPSRLALRVPTA